MIQVIGPTASKQWRFIPSLFFKRESILNLLKGLVRSSSLQRDGETRKTKIRNTNDKGRQRKHANQHERKNKKQTDESKDDT